MISLCDDLHSDCHNTDLLIALVLEVASIAVTPSFPDILLTLVAAVIFDFRKGLIVLGFMGFDISIFHLSRHK